jgi:hypothetical protein
MQPDDTPGAFALLDSLDEPGPALPISDAQAQLLVQGAMAGAARPMRPPRRMMRFAVAATICAALAGTAAAAIWYARSKPAELPAPTAPAPIKPPPAPQTPMVAPPPSAFAPPPIVIEPPARPRPTAAQDLLHLANQRRAQRQWREAQSLYRRVEREYASSESAYVAMLADASLRLEHLHDARGALGLYRTALAKGPGSLREEAGFGVAESYRALGQKKAESQALESFVAAHPDSPMTPRARERLEELRR